MQLNFIGWICFTAIMAINFGVQANNSSEKKIFSYRAEVPVGTQSCDDHAKSLARLFGASSGMTVVGFSCRGQNTLTDQGQVFTRDILQVDYLSENELIPSKAIFGGREFLGRVSDRSGIFLRYSDCLAALQLQTPVFETESGTIAVSGYCQISSDSIFPGFSLTIEGFGNPKRGLYSFAESEIMLQSAQAASDITEAAKKIILGAGAHIVFTDPTHIFYYDTGRVDVSVFNLGFLPLEKQCTDQQSEAQSIFDKGSSSTNSSALCLFKSNLTVVTGNADFIRDDFSGGSPRYSSFSDCMADRERVIQNFKSRGGNALGTICKPSINSSEGFVVTLFYGMR